MFKTLLKKICLFLSHLFDDYLCGLTELPDVYYYYTKVPITNLLLMLDDTKLSDYKEIIDVAKSWSISTV